MDAFDKPDITITTNDGEAAMALWEMRNEAKDAGDVSYDMAEKMKKAFTPERVHEIWLVVNDALQTGALFAGIYAALRTVEGLSSKSLSIRIGGRVTMTRDAQERLESLGCEIHFEKGSSQISLPEGVKGAD